MTHPLLPTQEQFAKWDSEYFDEEGENGERQNFDFMMLTAFQAGADQQLEQVIKWLNFGYQTDPNLSRERKHRGGFKEIAIALEKAMRPLHPIREEES